MNERKEKDIRYLKGLCAFTALAAVVVCVLFLLDVGKGKWMLGFVLTLGVLLHILLAMCCFMLKRKVLSGISLAFMVLYLSALIYFSL